MSLDRCLACQGTELHEVRAGAGLMTIGIKGGPFESHLLRFSVCLSCGFVAPFIDETGVRVVRRWKNAAERKKRAAAP